MQRWSRKLAWMLVESYHRKHSIRLLNDDSAAVARFRCDAQRRDPRPGWHRLVLALTNSTPNALDERPNYDEQLAWFDRFGQMHVEPCTERLGAIFSPCICR